MRKAEAFTSKPWFQPSDKSHGSQGHLRTEPYDLTPISELIRSIESKGLLLDADMFSYGETATGYGQVPRTVGCGTRSTGADFITNKNKRDNITIVTHACVDKVLLDQDNNGIVRAVGVRAILADGSVVEFRADKEVVVSGGAFCSPNILNRSGIGAREELEKHGILTLVDLPGVGKNLMDHMIVFLMYETNRPDLTLDEQISWASAKEKTQQLWRDEKRGALANVPFGVFAFTRLDERHGRRAPGRTGATRWDSQRRSPMRS